VLGATEDASVRALCCRSEGDFEGDTSRMGHLNAVVWHSVAGMVKGQVHVLCEEFKEVWAIEPAVDLPLLYDLLPDLALFAAGRLSQVLLCIELFGIGERAWIS